MLWKPVQIKSYPKVNPWASPCLCTWILWPWKGLMIDWTRPGVYAPDFLKATPLLLSCGSVVPRWNNHINALIMWRRFITRLWWNVEDMLLLSIQPLGSTLSRYVFPSPIGYSAARFYSEQVCFPCYVCFADLVLTLIAFPIVIWFSTNFWRRTVL